MSSLRRFGKYSKKSEGVLKVSPGSLSGDVLNLQVTLRAVLSTPGSLSGDVLNLHGVLTASF